MDWHLQHHVFHGLKLLLHTLMSGLPCKVQFGVSCSRLLSDGLEEPRLKQPIFFLEVSKKCLGVYILLCCWDSRGCRTRSSILSQTRHFVLYFILVCFSVIQCVLHYEPSSFRVSWCQHVWISVPSFSLSIKVKKTFRFSKFYSKYNMQF